jgi:DNA-binding response OmpR family regulator
VEKQLLGSETVYSMRSKGVTAIIVGLSANDAEDRFLSSGANYFMYKPFPCKKVSDALDLLHCCWWH